jgi:hypothetical protein
VTELKYKMHIRDIASQGVRIPDEFNLPKGYFRFMPNGGFILADRTPRLVRDSTEVYRWLAFCEPVEVVDKKYLVIPRLYQRLGLLPAFGQKVVLFGADDWFEIWPVDKWVEQMRTTAGDLHNLLAAVKDELNAR